MTAFEAAKRRFPVGCKVEVRSPQPEWNPGYPCDKIVCGHVKYRDSAEDPMICVCLVSITDARAGWFLPDQVIKRTDIPNV